MRALGQLGLAAATVTVLACANAATIMTPAQASYMEGCGGCHGILGTSSNPHIPDLRGEVGRFLCIPAGRQYLIRLPNVAFADADDRMLADVMNFVVFELGGASVPAGARPYSTREIAALRRRPLKNIQLARVREAILAEVSKRCPAGS